MYILYFKGKKEEETPPPLKEKFNNIFEYIKFVTKTLFFYFF